MTFFIRYSIFLWSFYNVILLIVGLYYQCQQIIQIIHVILISLSLYSWVNLSLNGESGVMNYSLLPLAIIFMKGYLGVLVVL